MRFTHPSVALKMVDLLSTPHRLDDPRVAREEISRLMPPEDVRVRVVAACGLWWNIGDELLVHPVSVQMTKDEIIDEIDFNFDHLKDGSEDRFAMLETDDGRLIPVAHTTPCTPLTN